MQIPVNKNIDSYKDDFFKGLSFRETLYSFLTLVMGTAAFFLCYLILKLPQTISLYIALPAAMPFAMAGFGKIHGLPIGEYLKLKRQAKRKPEYVYKPEYLRQMVSFERADPKPGKGKNKELFLGDEKEADEFAEEDAGV